MRDSKRDLTHAALLHAAGRNFRKYGYSGVGVDALAKAGGVTSGAFYAHFGSKDGAFQEVIAKGLDEVIEGLIRFQAEAGRDWLIAFADYYLGAAHRNDLACGCAMASLGPEVMRGASVQKDLFGEKMDRIIQTGADGLEGGDAQDRRIRFCAVLSALVGGLTFARAAEGSAVCGEMSAAARQTALTAAGPTREVTR